MMINFQKIEPLQHSLEYELPKVKTKDIIKLNLGITYFIALTFLIIKLLFT